MQGTPQSPERPAHDAAPVLGGRFPPGAPEPVVYWAARWQVSPLTVLAAIGRAGPLLRDVTVEVWKTV